MDDRPRIRIIRLALVTIFAVAALAGLLIATLVDFSGGDLRTVQDPTRIELATGGGSGRVLVYGLEGAAPTRFWSDGCRLLNGSGEELNRARITNSSPFTGSAELDGKKLQPLLEVSSVSTGQVLECPELPKATPIAISEPTMVGSGGRIVRGLFLAGSLGMVAMMFISWFLAPAISRAGLRTSRPR